MKYNNKQLLNDGFRIKGQVPSDDRTVLGAVSELYVSPSNRGEDTLFNRAYVGLKVTIESDNFASYVCVNAGPYTPGSEEEVKLSNWKNYWQKENQDIYDYITQNVDTSIRDLSTFVRSTVNTSVNLLETYVKTNIIPDSNNNGLNITPTLGETGNTYSIKVNTDSSTVAIVNDRIVGGTYRIVKDEVNDLIDSNLFARYNLVYRQPGSSTDVSVGSSATIEIPKVQVLKDASICKAEEDETMPGGYRVTSYQNDPSWVTDDHEVFICVAWDIQNGSTNNLIGNSDGLTYINIDYLFERNFENLESSIYDISVRFREADASIINYVNTNIDDLSTRVTVTDSSIVNFIGDLSTRVNEADTSIYKFIGDLSTRVNDADTSIVNFIGDLSTRVNESDTSIVRFIGDLSTRVNESDTSIVRFIGDLSTRVNDADTSIYKFIGDLSTRIHVEDASIVHYVNTNFAHDRSNISRLDTNISRLDTSVVDLHNEIIENEQIVAASLVDISSNMVAMYNRIQDQIIEIWQHIDPDPSNGD